MGVLEIIWAQRHTKSSCPGIIPGGWSGFSVSQNDSINERALSLVPGYHSFQKWAMDGYNTPRSGLDFCNLESPTKKRKFPRQLASMINGNTEEWDCAMFLYTIFYSDCLSHGVSRQVRSAVYDMRTLRNKIAYWPHAYVSNSDFPSFFITAETAFKSLNPATIPLQIIREKVHFSSGSRKELIVSLQFDFEGKSCFYLNSF